ncbi:beta strand repeat-containing protein [Luteolibacter soli]|uniref:Autotransporter-associated beta strand repeat-containing protein n=1 Tax=Luteolibacter soli TaxID=3135280 RepID=A0ABU9ASJ5_9BACT
MNTSRIKRSPFTRRWLLGSAALGIVSAPAATVTWTGGGADTNYDTAANWNPGVPATGDNLVFPDSASFLDVGLNGTFSPAKLTFSATGFNDYSFDGPGTLVGTGVILEKTGSAYLFFGGLNSFTGEVRVNAGKLTLSNSNLTGNTSYAFGATGNTIKIASGATLDLNGQGGAVHATAASRRTYKVEIAGNGMEDDASPGTFLGAITSSTTGNLAYAGRGKSGVQDLVLTADASIRVPSNVSFDVGFGTTTSSGTKHVLTKTGGGTLFIGGTGTTGGSVTGYDLVVSEGVLSTASVAGLGDKVTVKSGAVLNTASSLTVTTPIELEDGAILADYVGTTTYSGTLTLLGTPKFRATNTVNLTIASTLNGPGDIVVERTTASGNVIFTKDNIIAGNLNVTGTIAAQLGSGGTTGSFKDSGGNDSPVNLNNGTVTLNRSDSFTYNAAISGTGTLSKSGNGIVRRTVESPFSRPSGTVVAVNAGSLLFNNATGDGAGEGSATVAAGATLGGTGSIVSSPMLGSTVATRAYLAPGDGPSSIGTFTTGGVQVASMGTGAIQIEVNGAAADKLVVNGDLILGPAKIAEIAIVPFGSGATQPSYTVLQYTGVMHGTFNSITGVPAGYRVRHDVANKRIVLEQSAATSVLPQVMYYDGGTVDIVANGDAAAAATAGNWNTTLLNWDQGAVAHLPWANDGSATAILAVGAYTVTVDAVTPLSVAGIKRIGATASATTITGGTLDLQAGAPLHEAAVGTSDQGLRIASKLTGSGGFTVSGRTSSGTNFSRVTLVNPVAGNNTISGPVAIDGGYLRLAASEQLGNSSVITANTVISGATATLETGSSVNETIAGLNFGPGGGELKLGGASASELTLDGGGLSIANAATITCGNSASGIRFANAGEFVKSGDSSVTITRVNAANFIDLGGTRTIRVNDSGILSLGVNLVNGALVKQGTGTLTLTSDANAYQGNTMVVEGILRLSNPTLYGGATLDVDSDALLDLGFVSESTVNVVKSFIVGGVSKPAGRYGPQGTTEPGVTGLAEITGSGIIEVNPAWTADPFIPWAMQISNPDKRGKADDADGDGFDNLTEFAFDGNPTSGVASGKIQTKGFSLGGENALVITIPVRTGAGAFSADGSGLVSSKIDGVIYRVQGSTNLSTWTLSLSEVAGTPGITLPAVPLSSAAWEYRSFRINGPISAQAKAFLRASATE